MSLRNSIEAAVLPLAAAALGAQISPVNFRLKARELRGILDLMGAQIFLYGPDFGDVVETCRVAGDNFVTVDEFKDSLQAAGTMQPIDGFESSCDPYTLMWTSGTGGSPKPCRGSLGARMNWMLTIGYVYDVRPADGYVAALPMTHSAGMTFALAHLFFGATVHMLPRFEAKDVWQMIHDGTAASGLFVPTMLQMLIDEDREPQSPVPATFRTIVTAGSRLRPALHAQILERFPNRLFNYYGSTESPSMTVLRPHEQAAHSNSVGRPYFGVEIAVRNLRESPEFGAVLGDIEARNPFAMDEYGVAGMAVPVSPEGWIQTGDIGYLDEGGYLHVFGRASDVIVSGGLNVSLPEIERVIATHPEVRDVVVVSLEDEKWGDVPVAAIVPRDVRAGQALLDAIDRLCREELAGYKRPRRITAVEEIPRTASGKPSLAEVRALILASGESDTVQI
jgi:acyl-CoA synthetase (AMP-forming)/AMP-acid ligase II